MYVIALRQLAVAAKPGSYVNRPVSFGSLPMSTHGAPSVPVWTGSSTFLPAALSTTLFWSDTG